jgi:hypothetical protein
MNRTVPFIVAVLLLLSPNITIQVAPTSPIELTRKTTTLDVVAEDKFPRKAMRDCYIVLGKGPPNAAV